MKDFETYQSMHEEQKKLKELWVKDHPKEPDGPATVVCYRDGEPVLRVFCDNESGNLTQIGAKAAFGTSANAVHLFMEALRSTTEINPETGKPWEPNEMSVIWQSYPEYMGNLLYEAYFSTVFDRDGEWAYFSDSFTTKDGEVTWGESRAITKDDDKVDHGGMAKAMQHAMQQSDLTTETAKLAEEFGEAAQENLQAWLNSPEGYLRSRAIQDVTTASQLIAAEGVLGAMLIAAKGSERAKYLQENQERLFDRVRKEGLLHPNAEVTTLGGSDE